ncbi:MAG: phosphate ABC transporter substrate-binding protein [Lachnospiraceae bacterium]|nr:phosphate ABC transporter substrate-binding protein [Lachnospiraceae bacterium]
MKKAFALGLAAVMAVGMTGAVSAQELSGSITGSGSSALLPLAQDAADAFKELYPDVSITLNGGGSGTGLKQVSDGSVDIGNSDVAAETKLEADAAAELVDHKVCVVTMAPIVNKEVGESVTSLTKEQLIDIFTGEVTNWNEVGGPDEEIILITRPQTSGTRALFKEYALDGNEELSGGSLETDDSGTLLQSVADNEGAIGYIALPYLMNNDTVSVVAIDGVEPSLENTYNGTYPVWGYEHMYTKGEASEVVQAFIDFITGDEYGKRIEEQGYGVTAKMTVER